MLGVMEDVTPDVWIANDEACMKQLKDVWEKIPLLGSVPDHLLKEGQLIRFRGMVQDMLNPVYYISKYEVFNKTTGTKEVRSGKFRETICCKENETILFESKFCESKERRQYYCINVPALNEWACPNVEYKYEMPNFSPSSQAKRSAEEMEVEAEVQKLNEENISSNKRQCRAPASKEVNKELQLHFPIPEANNHACLISLYDVEDGCVKVNDIIESVGFLWYPIEDDEENIPGSLLPRLHSVSYKKIPNSNPLYLDNINNSEILLNASTVREKLHDLFTQLLLGDTLAADYLICNLLSSIFSRQDFLALGKFSVNISNVPVAQDYVRLIYNVICELVAKSYYLPMSLRNMNTLQFLPVKDYESNRLKSGVLQLSKNTHLILDETKLEVGKLEEKGVNNVRALNELIKMQSLDYDFKFYKMDFPTDIPVLTLSEGKSLLESDVHVIMEPVESCVDSLENNYEDIKERLKEPLLSQLRLYITAAARAEFNMPDDMLEVIQDDFVKMRQIPELKMSSDDLHNLLVLARLMSLSYGHGALSKETWDRCREMEITRKLRIAKKESNKKS